MTDKLKIIFMGSPDFASTALRAICEQTNHMVACVYSQPPRPKGRGHQVQKSPVHAYAEEQGIEMRTPKNLKSTEDQAAFIALDADIAIVAAYGLLLPKAILDAPKYGCINIHASLLPRWRGASPIQQAIWSGDDKSGVTLMQMDEGLDTGAMISKSYAPITADTTALLLNDTLANQGGELIIELLSQINNGTAPTPQPQEDELTTYAPLLKKSDGVINWNDTATAIDRQIRALTPWPGVKNGDFKFLEAKPVPATTIAEKPEIFDSLTKDHSVGTLVRCSGYVICGQGSVLQLIQIQPNGKKPMDVAAAINGGYLKVGDVLT